MIGKTLDAVLLAHGEHSNPEDGMCAMEAVAWLAGEPHSDHPTCASPVIAAYVRPLNDAMPDDQRQRLKPYIARLIGSAHPALDLKRSHVLAWASITQFAPTALDAIGLVDHANTLRGLTFGDWAGADTAADAAYAAADAAYADAAYAAASAARAARAAHAAHAAHAAASAAHAAASAAHAAASADRAAADAAPTGNVWDLALSALDAALAVTEEIA